MYIGSHQELIIAENYDLQSIVTPVDYKKLRELLLETGYEKEKMKFLIDGFKNGFDIGYWGPENVQLKAPNLK